MKPLSPLLAVMASLSLFAADPAGATAHAFGDELTFLRRHTEVVVLRDAAGGAQVAVVPAYQGRVMTSTAQGLTGTSFGWVNRDLIASGRTQPHINVYGGEDRFWLGPEGGQFSIFFGPGAAFDLEHWFTPAPIDTEPFAVIERHRDRVVCQRRCALTNYSGTRFELEITRQVRLTDPVTTLASFGIAPGAGVRMVAFESINTVKNVGQEPWRKPTGLLSIWILGMFNASPAATVAIPYVAGPTETLGPIVNDTYFGKVPAERLRVGDGVLFFKADAQYRSKIGLSPRRARSTLGSYDPTTRTLTLVRYTLPAGVTDYVNSMWQIQDNPWAGDVINSYNDGPPKPGAAQMGRFYEMETSSPALALAAQASATHSHQTIHLQGDERALDRVARAALGVELKAIARAFGGSAR